MQTFSLLFVFAYQIQTTIRNTRTIIILNFGDFLFQNLIFNTTGLADYHFNGIKLMKNVKSSNYQFYIEITLKKIF